LGYLWIMGNTEGSRVVSGFGLTHITLQLTQEEQDVIFGCILGDAYIYPEGKICIEHGEKQYAYIEWLYTKLHRLRYQKLSCVTRIDKRYQKKTVSYRFFLRQWFRPLREKFYDNHRKRIPINIVSWLNPRIVAIWYMDDGYLDKKTYPLLMTDGYLKEDVLVLQKALTSMKVASLLTTHNRLRIASGSRNKFFQLIHPYIHQSMQYKLP
jgi:hypothetical protein